MPHPQMGSTFLRRVIVLATGTAASQALVIAVAPLLTRIYAPEQFGVLSVYSSILSIVVVAAGLRYELAMPLPRSQRNANALLQLCIVVNIAFAVVAWVAISITASKVTTSESASSFAGFAWVLPLGLMGGGLYQSFNYWAIRQNQWNVIARTKFTQGFGQAASQLLLGALGAGTGGLLIGDVIGRTAGVGRIAIETRRDPEARLLARVSLARVRRVAYRYRRFPLIAAPSSILNSMGVQLPTVFVASIYGPATAGLFGLALRVVGVPMLLVGRAVAQVYLGEVSEAVRRNRADISTLFIRTARKLFLYGGVPVAIMAVAGPRLFSLIFGAAWTEAGSITRILSIMFVTQFVASPLSQTLYAIERQDLQLSWDSCRLLIVCVSFWAVWRAGAPFSVAISIYGAVMTVCYGALLLLVYYSLKKRLSSVKADQA